MDANNNICPVCGAQLEWGAKRCSVCGAVINNTGQVPPQYGNTAYVNQPQYGNTAYVNQPQYGNTAYVNQPQYGNTAHVNQPQYQNMTDVNASDMGNNEKGKDNRGLIAGLIITVAVLMISLAVFLILFFKNKNSSNKSDSKSKKSVKTTTEAASFEEDVKRPSEDTETFDTEKTEESYEDKTEASEEADKEIDYSKTYVAAYDGFKIEIPEYWSDKVTIEENDINSHFGSVVFYQTASHDSGGGMIAYICWYLEGDESYTMLPSYNELGTGNGKQYIICYPTDVQYDYENQKTAFEYSDLTGGLYVIEDSFTVIESSREMQFVFPDSDSAYISDDRIASCSDMELRIAKNELYARRGRIFETEPFVSYFGELSWYEGSVKAEDFDEAIFNEYETANRDAIVAELTNRGLK